MRALEFITGHVIYNPAYTYKFQLKTTVDHLLGVPMFLREDYFLKTTAVFKNFQSSKFEKHKYFL